MSTVPPRPGQAQSRIAAGEALLAQGAVGAARDQFNQALAIDPALAGARLGLAKVARTFGDWQEAERLAREAVKADPAHAASAHYLGALLVEQDRLAEARPLLEAAAERSPAVLKHQRDLGVTLLFLGDLAGARRHLQKALELDVHGHEVLYTLIRTQPMGDGSEAAERLLTLVRELEARSDLPPDERVRVLFALGKAHEDRGEFSDAAAAFRRANAMKRAVIAYDIDADERRMREIAEVIDAALIRRLADAGDPTSRPIFIVGMPRSGSTLVEQMLASHPYVHGGGEMNVLPQLLETVVDAGAGARFPAWAAALDGPDCLNIGRAYLARIPIGSPPRRRTTDKWLENFEHLGMIAVCLPRAKVIHCRRDPRDQLLSCWSLLFSQSQNFVYEPGELIRYARAYRALMAHWRAVLPPGLMLEVDYEALVADPEGQARRVLQHCGLEWDERVMRYWETERPVRSASMAQVREPIYDRSIGRWRAFEPFIPELLGAQALGEGFEP